MFLIEFSGQKSEIDCSRCNPIAKRPIVFGEQQCGSRNKDRTFQLFARDDV